MSTPSSPASPSSGEHTVRAVVRMAGWLLVAVALAYPADWAIWWLRVAFGGGMGSVTLSQVTAAELKGNKESYYWDGNVSAACSRSFFPQGTYSACWYLRRHAETITRY